MDSFLDTATTPRPTETNVQNGDLNYAPETPVKNQDVTEILKPRNNLMLHQMEPSTATLYGSTSDGDLSLEEHVAPRNIIESSKEHLISYPIRQAFDSEKVEIKSVEPVADDLVQFNPMESSSTFVPCDAPSAASSSLPLSLSQQTNSSTMESNTLISDTVAVTVQEQDQISSSVSTTQQQDVKPVDPVTLLPKDDPNSFRHGISRYAPYGTRFAAQMKDGSYKTSHIAGDLANRAKAKKGGRVDLVLVTHDGEREQLDAALCFYESTATRSGPKPGPSEVLNHLKDLGIDWDYRKGDNVKLLQRNASNFFKRMMEHARRVQHPMAEPLPPPPVFIASYPKVTTSIDPEVSRAAEILASMIHAKFDDWEEEEYMMDLNYDADQMEVDPEISQEEQSSSLSKSAADTLVNSSSGQGRRTDWTRPLHKEGSFYYEVNRIRAQSVREENEFYERASKNFDWSSVEDVTAAYKPTNRPVSLPSNRQPIKHYAPIMDSDSDFEEYRIPKKQKVERSFSGPKPRQAPKPFTSNGSVISSAPPVIRKGREGLSAGVFLKGLSRHSPYGTRFCATMPNGEKRESYLAGDLADRIRTGPGGGELLLVLHAGEIDQLQSAWQFVSSHLDAFQVSAGAVLEHLRMVGKDANHRKPGTALLQKNAGNFFKRVQEYGRRKQSDANYLSLEAPPTENIAVESSETSSCVLDSQPVSN